MLSGFKRTQDFRPFPQYSQREKWLALPEARKNLYIFSAETTSVLAWVYYFLREQLEQIEPFIPRRIKFELERRIFVPYDLKNDMKWMGLDNAGP